MKISKFLTLILLFTFIASPLFSGVPKAEAQQPQPVTVDLSQKAQANVPNDEIGSSNTTGQMRTTTMAMRIAAALRLNPDHPGSAVRFAGINPDTAKISPLGKVGGTLAKMANFVDKLLPQPDYFGVANWANSPLPQLDTTGNIIPGTGMRKFVDGLPVLCPTLNDLQQCIPLAVADTTTFAGSDYYEIAVVEYREQLHTDLPATGTQLRGYVQVSPTGTYPLTYLDGNPILNASGVQVMGVTSPHYLGPMILAHGCSEQAPTPLATCTPTPVRVKFTNYLPKGSACAPGTPCGDLFIPMDSTYMGAGMGPGGSILSVQVTAGGSGYTAPPSVAFTGGAGINAAATAIVVNGAVTAITVNQGGSGYTSAPTITLSGGGGTGATATAVLAGQPGEMYTQNRATLHLHGGNTPWISDGTTHQWTTPAGATQPGGKLTSYSRGDSVAFVPDMWFDANGNVNKACSGSLACPGYSNDPGPGSLTFYWTNQQSGRLLFFHDHAYGTTRLDVYAGEAAGYLIADPSEEDALYLAGVPGTTPTANTPGDLPHLIPLVIQDKTFVPDTNQLALTDPTWDVTNWGGLGNLWFPHVYIPNQNPADVQGANAFGRWDYGAWFWPPQDPSTYVGQPYPCTSAGTPPGGWAFPPLMCPGIPNPSGTPEAFMDTPVINGTAYPTLTVDPTSYRFQMLMAGNDRSWNLQLYQAEPLTIALTEGGSGYTITPTVQINGGTGGLGAAAIAQMSHGSITSIMLTNVGSGYTTATVTIDPPPAGGIQATATASIDPITKTVDGIHITNIGAGYVTVPNVSIAGDGLNAAAIANVTAPGVVLGVKVTNYGSTPWTAAPTITFVGANTTPAVAYAVINSEVKMVPAEPHDATSPVPLCDQVNPTSGAMLVTAIVDASGNPINGTGLPAGCWPSQWPTDGRDGGVPDPLMAGPALIQLGTEGGLLPAPVIIPATPVGYEYNRRSITVLNIFTHGLLLGPAERADVMVDFSQYAGQTLLLYNDAPAPVPAFDSRTDYYTGDVDQTAEGGAPSTLPGYGPNTRTIMQIKVNPVTPAPQVNMNTINAAATNTFVHQQNQMIVPEPGFPVGNGNSVAPAYARISDTSMPGWYNGQIGSLVLTNGGQGYSSAPSVALTGGGGTGATASLTFLGANVNLLTLTAGGSGYTIAPTVAINGGGGTGATASSTISNFVSGVAVTNRGSGYTSAPTVNFSGGGGSGAAATAATTNIVQSVAVSNRGSGYTSAPTVVFTGGGGSGAAATAGFTRVVNTLTLGSGGTGYNTAPTVNFTGGGGSGALATATIDKYVNAVAVTNQGRNYTTAPTVVFTGGGPNNGNPTIIAQAHAVLQGTHILNIVVTNGGSGYVTAPVVTFTGGGGGTGASATATITGKIVSLALTNGGSGYTSAPTVSFSGGGGSGATATATITGVVPSVTVTAGGSGYTSAPGVSFTGGAGTGAAATANLTGVVASVTMTSFGTLYTSAPTVSFSGGGGSGAAATASISGYVNSLLITNAGSSYTSNPTVAFSGGGGTGAAATATYLPGFVSSLILTNSGTGYTSAPSVVFSGGGTPTIPAAAYATAPVIQLGAKAIQELFTLDYGRMNATLGVELPFTNFFVQTTIPYGYVDPPTEMFKSGDTIFWKITHNGVDTHFIHFHLYDLQVINRVGWDGMIKPPDVNEFAWKDTVRMNPLEDIIVAMRPMKQNLPWELPNSYRPLDVTESIGASNPNNMQGFANIDPSNAPAPVTNDVTNFGWEYVVHCHILGHEENDMMRAQLLAVPPDPPTLVNAVLSGSPGSQIATVTWNDGSNNETGFTVQRATTPNGPWLSLTPAAPPAPGIGTPMTFIDSGMPRFTTFYYQVVANNVVGYTAQYAAPAIGYPTLSADSAPVAAPLPLTILSNSQPGPIFADSFETGLNMWSGVIGNSNVITNAVIGPNGGKLGLVTTIDSSMQPAYVYDLSPNAEVMYDGNFYFNPNKTVTDGPVDIFLGLDQNGQPTFGVQYQYVDANSYDLRAWAMHSDGPEFSSWDVFAKEAGDDNPMALTHKVEVAWASSTIGGISFYVDNKLFRTLTGDTSAFKLEEVILGPSLGLTANDSGSMYFDEFTSSRVPGLTFMSLLPVINR